MQFLFAGGEDVCVWLRRKNPPCGGFVILKVSCFQQVEIFVNRTAGNIPAEILPHGVLGHLSDFVRVAVEGFKGFLQRFGIGVDIVFRRWAVRLEP